MKEKINIAELLKNCPKDMELDCTMYEDVYFDYVDELSIIHCYIKEEGLRTSIHFNQFGTPNSIMKSKCVIFPKGRDTWEGFQRPFKDGDIVAVTLYPEGTWIGIFKRYQGELFVSHCSLNTSGQFRHFELSDHSLAGVHLATEEEKEKLFKAIKEHGYHWNVKNKSLDKLPKFKVGDRIRRKGSCKSGLIICMEPENFYKVEYSGGEESCVNVEYTDDWELAPNKFDINTLVPFESKVLVRGNGDCLWKPATFGCFNDNFFYVLGGNAYRQCIPYEGNEHLRGTTDDCVEYYKNWE